MRAYFFTNMYLSSIQNGIQPQHCTSELFVKYRENEGRINPVRAQALMLYEWAEHHKTTIVLNGGYSSVLRELIDRFDSPENPYPWTYFTEDEDAIGPLKPTEDRSGGALTAVAIVLPEKIYGTAHALRTENIAAEQIPVRGEWKPFLDDDTVWEISKWEYELCLEMNKFGMAS